MLWEKKEKEGEKIMKELGENGDMEIVNGGQGGQIGQEKKNYKIGEKVNGGELKLDGCLKVIELEGEKGEMGKGKGGGGI